MKMTIMKSEKMSYEPDTAETLDTIAAFVAEAPPGELSDVLNDLRGLVANDELLQEGIAQPFAEYNVNTLQTVAAAGGAGERFILSKYSKLDGGRFVNFKTNTSCAIDHVAQTASDPQPHEVDAETEEHRLALQSAIESYTQDHYPNGESSVSFCVSDRTLRISIVSNKFNPNNFWNGRWVSEWTAAVGSEEVDGQVNMHVHYYEDGNVQVKTNKKMSAKLGPVPSDPTGFAATVVKQILKAETDYQMALNASYSQISDSTFKALRRALPITRTKLDWNSVSNYKIGAELSNK
ncbi:F-actin-capping protein subunit alpha-2-like protein [Chytriomyces sp. MP71]|nr:F-actin-capping protein subunit alpha-2-like protein [Chytriomyces sp. MP71]